MPDDRGSEEQFIPTPSGARGSQVAGETTASDDSLLHPKRGRDFIWALLLLVAGGLVTLMVQRLSGPQEIRDPALEAILNRLVKERDAPNRRELIQVGGAATVSMVESGRPYTYAVNMPGSTVCEMTSPVNSGVSTSMSMTIEPDHPFYPRIGHPTVIRVQCDSSGVQLVDEAIVGVHTSRTKLSF